MKYLFTLIIIISTSNVSIAQTSLIKKFAKYYLDDVFRIENVSFQNLKKSKQQKYYNNFIEKIGQNNEVFTVGTSTFNSIKKQLNTKPYETIVKADANTFSFSSIKKASYSNKVKSKKYNELLRTETNRERREEIIGDIFELRYSKLTKNEKLNVIRKDNSPFTTKPNYQRFGKEFNTYKEVTTYTIKLQTILKEMNLLNSLVDGIYGPKTEKALHKLMDFFEIPTGIKRVHFINGHTNESASHGIFLDFSNNKLTTRTNKEQAKKVSEKLLKKRLEFANEICFNTNGKLSWEISLQNISVNVELPTLDFSISATHKSGRKHVYNSNTNVQINQNNNCNLQSFCLSKNPIVIVCENVTITGFNSLNLSVDNYNIEYSITN